MSPFITIRVMICMLPSAFLCKNMRDTLIVYLKFKLCISCTSANKWKQQWIQLALRSVRKLQQICDLWQTRPEIIIEIIIFNYFYLCSRIYRKGIAPKLLRSVITVVIPFRFDQMLKKYGQFKPNTNQ